MRLGGWILAISAALTMVGCSSSSSNASGGETPTAKTDAPTPGGGSEKKFKIAVSIPAATHGWTAGVIWWAEETKKKHTDVDISVVTADGPEKQISDLETLMGQKPDALVVLATESAPLTPVAKQIQESGIFLTSVDRGFTEPVADLFVAGDNKAFGQKSAEFMVEKLGGKGNIVVLEGLPSVVNTDRVNGAMEVFKKYPDIKIVAQQSGRWNRQEALKVMETILVAQKKIDAVWASDDDMALGVEQAVKEAGREKEMWILGGAGMKDVVKRVMDKDPLYPATVTYSPRMIAVAIEKTIELLKAGKKDISPTQTEILPVEIIDPANAKDHYFPNSVY